jgi:glycosyltransferase involved in cell wall biosynthesis
MKILVINNNVMLDDGKGLFIYKGTGKFLIELKESGHDVDFFQLRFKNADNDCLANFNVLDKGLKISAIPRATFKIVSYIQAYTYGILQLLKNDFIYLFYPNNFFLLAFFAIFFRKPYGLYVRGEKGINSIISKYLFKHASVVLTISPKFTELVNQFGCKAESIRPMMDYSEKDIVENRKYNLKEVYNLLFLGRIEYAKGVFDLVDAISLLIKKGVNNFRLDVVGDGPDAVAVKEKVKEVALCDYIKLHGAVYDKDRIINLYRNADIFILPTHHEGFPRVLYEAMIFGTPIITTFVGSIAYLMKDNYNCYKIKPKDPSGLCDVIASTIMDYETKSTIALNGTTTIRNYLSKYNESHSSQLNRILSERIEL